VLNDDGQGDLRRLRDRLDAHKLIEEFMVLANVAAAEELIAKRNRRCCSACTRNRRPRSSTALREVAEAAGLLAKGQVLKTRAPQPAAEPGRGHRDIRRADQHDHAALDDAGLLQPEELRAFRPGAAAATRISPRRSGAIPT
jgi:hypothetical protein